MDYPFVQQLQNEYENHYKVRCRDEWGLFLARWDWEWFPTYTFTQDTHPERALKLFRVWKNKLNKQIYGPRWHKREPFGIYWVISIENHKSGQIHLHGLIAGVGDARRLSWMDNWFELDKLAGFSRIYQIENKLKATTYVSKYVTKGGDIYFSENLKDTTGDLVSPAADCLLNQTPERKAPGVHSSGRQ